MNLFLYQLKETASLRRNSIIHEGSRTSSWVILWDESSLRWWQKPCKFTQKPKTQAGARFIIPTIRDFSPELLGNIHKQHRAYDIHRAWQMNLRKYSSVLWYTADAIQKSQSPAQTLTQVLAAGTQVKTRYKSHNTRSSTSSAPEKCDCLRGRWK